ncbi:MAG: serine hydrolase domain-containing protein [Actinomycetota bacterium]|nr:serine hydrolase domain-containing protein [Actinomycetota bacterium]
MDKVGGNCQKDFEAVRAAFEKNFDEGDLGASCAVVVDGETVVDLWGGTSDVAGEHPWERDTIVNVWSTTKTMAALCVLMLYDRGSLDVDDPVAEHWPEFAANGKEAILVRHLLSHSAGLPGFDAPISKDQLFDWEYVCERLASQAPWWEPGTMSAYHSLTQGWLLGEVLRRVDGRTLGTFFAEEVAGPTGADFHIGLADRHFGRVAELDVSEVGAPRLDRQGQSEILDRVDKHGPGVTAELGNTDRWRRSEFAAANGHGNARSVAEIHSVIACNGTARGVTLLSPETVDKIFEVQTDGHDPILGGPIRYGLGFGLRNDTTPISPNDRACFWGGWGGSLAVIDVEARMSVVYVMNRMSPETLGDNRAGRILMAAHAARMSS